VTDALKRMVRTIGRTAKRDAREAIIMAAATGQCTMKSNPWPGVEMIVRIVVPERLKEASEWRPEDPPHAA
jgi:hypothetical protein